MSSNKKLVRAKFRASVFKRDKYQCKMCGYVPKKKPGFSWAAEADELDAHHITDRSEMPNGGYVLENGIALCSICHIRAEKFHETGKFFPGYSREDLYNAIKSSSEEAIETSLKLK